MKAEHQARDGVAGRGEAGHGDSLHEELLLAGRQLQAEHQARLFVAGYQAAEEAGLSCTTTTTRRQRPLNFILFDAGYKQTSSVLTLCVR